MPFVTVTDGCTIHYSLEGDASDSVLMFSNSLGTHLGMWDSQVAEFLDHFRILRYDTRGHGQSEAPIGSYNLDVLGQDVVDLLNALGISRVHFCGLSLGGMTGMWLGAQTPDLVQSLTLCCTSAYLPPVDLWNARITHVASKGMESIADVVLSRWFTAASIESEIAAIDLVREQLLSTSSTGYIACCAAIRDMDLRRHLKGIQKPGLVIAGAEDLATPPDHGRFIANEISDCHYVEIEGAAHLSNIEQADRFNGALSGFLRKQGI